MIDTVALREKVLDLAIRGKLVPQDPDDEPASVLLERIRAQKQQMVKDGKLKPKDIKDDTVIFVGEDNLHYEKFADGTVKCIEDELPFELPAGWAWARINTLCILNPKNTIPDNTTASFVPMPLIKEGYANEHTFEERKWNSIKNGFTHFANNDIGIAKITPCFENRKSVVFRSLSNGIGAGTTELFVVRCINDTVLPDYLLWNFKTQKFIDGGIQTYTGDVGQQRVRRDYVSKYLIALPPHAEQNRIIISISSLFELISSLDASYAEMSDLVLKTKSKILDLAIRGKLVPQDPNDEPAPMLLDRIRAEKEELIKQGKIKRDKKESVIFRGEDNSYYDEVPENWAVSTLNQLTHPLLLNDGDWILSENMNPQGEIKLIQLGSVGMMRYVDKGFKHLTESTFQKLNCTQIYPGYMLVNRIVSDKMCSCILPTIEGKLITTVDTCWVAPKEEWYNLKYLMYALSSPSFQSLVMLNSAGTTRKRISKNNLINLPFAFPPLDEQHRIVEAIKTAFAQLDAIAESLN